MRFRFFRLIRHGLWGCLPVGVAGLVVWGLAVTNLLTPLAQADYGLRFRLRGQRPWADSVVLIAIDDASLTALGAFPWPRHHYAELLDHLQRSPPQVVAFNLLMSDARGDDGVLAEAIAAHQAVILATAWDRQGRPLEPQPILAEAALATGHILQPTQGGYVHTVSPVVQGRPALALAVAEVLSLIQQPLPLPPLDRPLWVNWPGPAAHIPTYSFVDVLQGQVPPERFHGKVVLVGATALGLDDWSTPFDTDPPASGVVLHGALVDNLLQGRWLRPVAGGWRLAVGLALGLPLVLRRRSPVQQGAIVVALVGGWGLASCGLMVINLWLPGVGPSLLLALTGGLTMVQQQGYQNRWFREQVQRLRAQHPLVWVEPLMARAAPAPSEVPFPGVLSPGLSQVLLLAQQLGQSQAVQAAIARSLPMGLAAADSQGTVWLANPLARDWLQLSPGQRLESQLVPRWLTATAWEQVWQRVTQGQSVPAYELHWGDRWYDLWLEPLGAEAAPATWPQGVVVLLEDITERKAMETALRQLNQTLEAQVKARTQELEQLNQSLQKQIVERQQAQTRLAYEALHDPLTGLPNRRQFLMQLQQQLEQGKDTQFAVLFLDCDRFKRINDSFGHGVGDELLKRVAAGLQDCVRPTDLIARFGGDEFTVLLSTLDQVSDAVAVAQRIRQRFAQALQIQQYQLFTNTSIGIVISGPTYQHPNDMLRDADTAMYQAKVNGVGYALFESTMHVTVRRSQEIETALRLALERQELRLHYQPIVSLATQQLMGCEALLRWQHPVYGLMLPDDFMAIAEETGLMVDLGYWVLRRACTQMQRWRRRQLMPSEAVLSVNLSASQFLQPDLGEHIATVLADTGLPCANLKLEITETVVIQKLDQVLGLIQALRDRGIQLSIDDFGTGYSSLSYLRQLPVDMLKIDRSFIADIHQSTQQYGIVEAIARLASHLNMQVIAEGVEHEAQRRSLQQLGCQFGQGYLFSRPLSPSQLSQYLAGRWVAPPKDPPRSS